MTSPSLPDDSKAPWIPPQDTILAIAVRFGIYSLLILAGALMLPTAARHSGVDFFRENRQLEWSQAIMLAIAALVFLAATRGLPEWTPCLYLCSALAGVAFTRELDSIFGAVFPVVGWAVPGAVVAIVGGRAVWRRREAMQEALPSFLAHRVFALLWAGFIVSVPFAQLVGHGAFLEIVMGDDYDRGYKRVIEETTETLGYVFILAGSVEALWLAKVRRRGGGRQNGADGQPGTLSGPQQQK